MIFKLNFAWIKFSETSIIIYLFICNDDEFFCKLF